MNKEALFLRGFAKGADLPFMLKTLHLGIDLHGGQLRDDGVTEYISHPLYVCRTLINHGIRDDLILATAIGHDLIEDTKITFDELARRTCLEEAQMIDAVSKKSRIPPIEYYGGIEKDIRLVLVKGADRKCNIDDMIEVYTPERLRRYISDTQAFVLPMMKRARKAYLEYGDLLVALRDHINGVMRAVNKVLELYDKLEKLEKSESKT